MKQEQYKSWLAGRIKACETAAKEYEEEGDYVQSAIEYAKASSFTISLKVFSQEE